ncbi:hypothetical protein NFI96_026841 [Prochilodus magdalenae]|nr:hypothetical protein NFI96_026841 [Prochilodus magdalenae]
MTMLILLAWLWDHSWMTAHHLKLNPSKTELLFIPSTTGPHCDLAISLGNSITPTEDARSLGVILDGQLSFSAHIANLTRSCRFLLYNIRRIRPFLSQEATQLLVQSLVISRLEYCTSLLAGLPLRAIRPLQLVQNAAARLIFNLPKFSHVTPLLRSLHWLPVAACIRFKTLRPTKPRIDQRLPTSWQWYQHWPPVRAVSELVTRAERRDLYDRAELFCYGERLREMRLQRDRERESAQARDREREKSEKRASDTERERAAREREREDEQEMERREESKQEIESS